MRCDAASVDAVVHRASTSLWKKRDDVNSSPRNLCFLRHVSHNQRNSVWIVAQKHDPGAPSVWLQRRPQTKPQTVCFARYYVAKCERDTAGFRESPGPVSLSAHSVAVSCLLYSTAVGDHVEPPTGALAMLCVCCHLRCAQNIEESQITTPRGDGVCVCVCVFQRVCVCVCVCACVCFRKLVILLLTYFSPASSSLAVNSLATVT